MNPEVSTDSSMACTPDIWELKLFLWTSADMPAWNDVLLASENALQELDLNTLLPA